MSRHTGIYQSSITDKILDAVLDLDCDIITDHVSYSLQNFRDVRETICNRITNLAIWIIPIMNKTKNNWLANRLHELAGRYQTRPQEGWTAPSDWECWEDQMEEDKFMETLSKNEETS